MPARSITLILPDREYRHLENIAIDNDRDPWQQARHFVRAALSESAAAAEPEHETDETRTVTGE